MQLVGHASLVELEIWDCEWLFDRLIENFSRLLFSSGTLEVLRTDDTAVEFTFTRQSPPKSLNSVCLKFIPFGLMLDSLGSFFTRATTLTHIKIGFYTKSNNSTLHKILRLVDLGLLDGSMPNLLFIDVPSIFLPALAIGRQLHKITVNAQDLKLDHGFIEPINRERTLDALTRSGSSLKELSIPLCLYAPALLANAFPDLEKLSLVCTSESDLALAEKVLVHFCHTNTWLSFLVLQCVDEAGQIPTTRWTLPNLRIVSRQAAFSLDLSKARQIIESSISRTLPYVQSVALPGGVTWYKDSIDREWIPEVEQGRRSALRALLVRKFAERDTDDIKDVGGCLKCIFPMDSEHEGIREMLMKSQEEL